jgi:hypothetical protein
LASGVCHCQWANGDPTSEIRGDPRQEHGYQAGNCQEKDELKTNENGRRRIFGRTKPSLRLTRDDIRRCGRYIEIDRIDENRQNNIDQ